MNGAGTRIIRLLLVDDRPAVRRGLRIWLALEPDVVLMDLLMPEMSGIEATGEIRRELPNTEVVALTSVLEDASVAGAIRAGAIGYLLKNTEADELRQALRAAAAGQVQLAPEAAARLMREVRAPDSSETLTGRETEVLGLLARGKADKQIARELFIGESTVKSHVHNILTKLNMKSRTQAALYAVRVGLVSADELSEESR